MEKALLGNSVVIGNDILLLGSPHGESTAYKPSAGGAVLGIIPSFVSKQQENLFLDMFPGDALKACNQKMNRL